jgi:putative peptidoglycan lipid II flippase
MFKFLHSESKTIIRAAVLVGVFSFVSRLVGFVRDRLLAGEFGAGDTLDVYYAAFKIPDLLFSLIVIGALSASFIPIFTKHYFEPDRVAAWKFANAVLHFIGIVMLGLSAILFVLAEPVSALIAPGFDSDKQQAVALFSRVMLLAQIFLALSAVFGSVLQSLRQYFLYAIAPVFYNVGIIIGAMFLVDFFGPIGLAWGVVLGAALHMGIQLYGCMQAGYKYEKRIGVRSPEIKQVISMTGPRLLGIAISQLMFVILTVIATTMQPGSVTIFQFSYNIQFFPIGVIGVSLAIAAFPLFSETLAKDDWEGFRQSFSSTIRQALFLLIPLTLLFLILRAQIVRVVVGAGVFDWESTILTADTLAFFALTFIPQSFIFILSRAFFAMRDTVTPLTAGVVGAFVGLITGFLFRESYGVVGLGMAYSLYAIVNLILLWVPLRQRIGSLDEANIAQSLMKLTVAGLVCGLLTQAIKPFVSTLFSLDTFLGVFFQGFIAGMIGLAGYLGAAWLLKSTELHVFVETMHRRVLKKITPKESISMQE